MCACSHNFTCGRCTGELSPEQFEDLLLDRNRVSEPIGFNDAA